MPSSQDNQSPCKSCNGTLLAWDKNPDGTFNSKRCDDPIHLGTGTQSTQQDSHQHEWTLIRTSSIATRKHSDLLDVLTDPGDSSETWACPCGERKFNFHRSVWQELQNGE